MHLRTVLLLLVALAIAALAALNWSTLATPTLVSLGVTSATLPLGLVMLALTVLLGVFFLAYVLYLQSGVLMETRRHTKELATQRELADRAEASRFTELRQYLAATQATADTQAGQARQSVLERTAALEAALHARIDGLEAAFHARIDQADNTTAAYFGQLEDRLETQGAQRGRPLAPATRPPGTGP